MDIFDEAIKFAVDAHAGALRKGGGRPYILHPIEVAAIAGSITGDKEVLAAAVLHDVVEDAEVSLSEIEDRFGKRVAALVGSESEDKLRHLPAEDTWKIRKEKALKVLADAEDAGVRIVFLADKLSNIRSLYGLCLEHGSEMWRFFHQRDPAMHEWYYRSVAELTEDLRDTPAWQEYNTMINKLFGGKHD